MKIWMRKIAVVFVAIMTLGMYVPASLSNPEAGENKDAFSSKTNINENALTPILDVEEADEGTLESDDNDDFLGVLAEVAKERTLTKLGPRIANQVEEEFMTTILPTMESVLEDILSEAGQDGSVYFGITEQPSNGFGEKIFHVHDFRTDSDIAKFHVRRDNRPLEGYWFNFHYHLSKDNFEEHHEIGEIYWDKNVPPKWMA